MDTVDQNHFKKDVMNNKYWNIKMCAVQKKWTWQLFYCFPACDGHTNMVIGGWNLDPRHDSVEGRTIQWPKEHDLQNIRPKFKYWSTRTNKKLWSSGRVNSSCSIIGTCWNNNEQEKSNSLTDVSLIREMLREKKWKFSTESTTSINRKMFKIP